MVHRSVCELRRGDGRGSREGPSRFASQSPKGHPGQANCRAATRCQPEPGLRLAAPQGGPRPRRSRRLRARRRRDRGRRRLRRRERDHRRERPGHPRERRGSQRGHRRDPSSLRLAHRARQRQPGRDVPRPNDRDGRRSEAPEDAERNRARYPFGGADDHLSSRHRDAPAVFALQRRRRKARNGGEHHSVRSRSSCA